MADAPAMNPPQHSAAVAASDAADLSPMPRLLRFNTAGTVRLSLELDTHTVATDAPQITVSAGEQMVGRFRRVWATGTTATCTGYW